LRTLALTLWGAVVGVASQLNWLAYHWVREMGTGRLAWRVAWGAALGPVAALLLRALCRDVARRRLTGEGEFARYCRSDWLPFAAFGAVFLGIAGIPVGLAVTVAMAALFAMGQGWLLARFRDGGRNDRHLSQVTALCGLFFLSGVAALVYQVIWQRVLFSAFGVNIESTTVVVSVFMLGLGLGSLLGGILSKRLPGHLPVLFLAAETCIGLFGLVSLDLIDAVSAAAIQGSLVATAAVVFALLLLPTAMMGATLPVLVTYLLRSVERVGSSVGLLYFTNTLGSAVACFATTEIFFAYFGLRATTTIAAAFNFAVGLMLFLKIRFMDRRRPEDAPVPALQGS